MAYSGEIGNTTFNALKVVDHAFRRCRLPAQAITAEMHDYAVDTLNTTLAELASIKTPSWCIEKIILPMYENQPIVTLPLGTVSVLNLNYRVLQLLSGANTTAGNLYQVSFTTSTVVDTVGIKWSGTAVPVLQAQRLQPVRSLGQTSAVRWPIRTSGFTRKTRTMFCITLR